MRSFQSFLSFRRTSLTFALLSLSLIWLGQVRESEAQRRGLVTSRPCPYSCRSQGIKKKNCRDWRQGNICYIEDLRKSPAPNRPTQSNPAPYRPPQYTPPQQNQPYVPPTQGVNDCRNLSPRDLPLPRINIGRVYKTGNIFKNKYKVTGSVEGRCLSEVGRFEDGRKDEDIRVLTTSEFRRFEFSTTVNASRGPEIRAYNTAGEVEILDIRPGDYDSNGRPTYENDDDRNYRDDDDDHHRSDDDDDDDSRRANRPRGDKQTDDLFGQIFGGGQR